MVDLGLEELEELEEEEGGAGGGGGEEGYGQPLLLNELSVSSSLKGSTGLPYGFLVA